MWKLILVFLVMAAINTEAAKRRQAVKRNVGGYAVTGGTGGAYGGGGAYAGGGAFASSGGYAGTGGGFGGSYYSDYDDYDNYAPTFGLSAAFIDPYEFHQRLTAQILSQHAANQNAIAQTMASEGASVTADASNLPDDMQIHNANRHYYNVNRNPNPGLHRGSHNRYAPNYSVASGSIGPGGYSQTAYISPENPAVPNIVNRFGGSSSPGGFKGVSVSSHSSNINGQPYRAAHTTVNDNGRVSTYSVHS